MAWAHSATPRMRRLRRGPGWGWGIGLLSALAIAPACWAQTPDLRPYPPAAPGEKRWFISVPAGLGAAADQRVELIVGRSLKVDCNRHMLQGSVEEESLPGWGYPIQRVRGGEAMASTRMACPGQASRREFVRLGGVAPLLEVNPRLPIVVYAPQNLEVRWRLWRADRGRNLATSF